MDGQDLSQSSERTLENYRLLKVGVIFQLFNLIPSMTAFGILELPMMVRGVPEDDRRARVEKLLAMVGLSKCHCRLTMARL